MAAALQEAVEHVGAVGPVGDGGHRPVVVVDLDRVDGVERGQPVGRREREVVETGVKHHDESAGVSRPCYGAGVVGGRRGLEVYGQAGGGDPVAVAVVPRGRAQLGADYRGEVLVAHGPGVGDPPSVLGLEVVGETKEVVGGVAVGAHDVFGTPPAVREVRVAMEVAAEEASPSVPEQIPRHAGSSLTGAPVLPVLVVPINRDPYFQQHIVCSPTPTCCRWSILVGHRPFTKVRPWPCCWYCSWRSSWSFSSSCCLYCSRCKR